MNDLNEAIETAIADRERIVITHHNLHSLYLLERCRSMRELAARATLTHVDGMALVMLGRALGHPLERAHRVTYADWIWSLMERANDGGWRVFYLGSQPGVAERGAEVLRGRFPTLVIATNSGYFDAAATSEESKAVRARIAEHRTDLLLVGMGMPRQERWIVDNLDSLPVNAILASGACIDYVAGEVPTPPRWMGRVGLEWLYRLASDPKRLARRYLVEPWSLAWRFVRELATRNPRA